MKKFFQSLWGGIGVLGYELQVRTSAESRAKKKKFFLITLGWNWRIGVRVASSHQRVADDILDFINIEESRLQYFKNAQKTGKLDRAIEAYKIYKKNKQKVILCP